MYPDALKDDLLASYLPSKKQLCNKLPERAFFFGIVSTLRRQYMLDVIRDAHAKRYKAPEGEPNKDSIVISDTWMAELTKHPYFSSKNLCFIFCRKTWYWHISYEGKGQDS